LPNKHKALSSNPSVERKKGRKEGRKERRKEGKGKGEYREGRREGEIRNSDRGGEHVWSKYIICMHKNITIKSLTLYSGYTVIKILKCKTRSNETARRNHRGNASGQCTRSFWANRKAQITKAKIYK
jgi:hypothetical protein